MLKFFNKHPVIAVFAITLVVGLAKGAYKYYSSDQHVSIPADVPQAVARLSSEQVRLTERDVQAAIRLIASFPKEHKSKAQSQLPSQLSLGIIGRAKAANLPAEEFHRLAERAGFKETAAVSGILVSVVLASMSIQFDEFVPKLADDIRKAEKMAADPKTTNSARAKAARVVKGKRHLLKLINVMLEPLNVMPENKRLVARHHAALMRSFGSGG